MKIVVIGGSGLIGNKLVNNLRERGHDAVSASPKSGVNAVTGQGLAGALAGCQVVVDVSNSPSFADQAVKEFFEASTSNLMAAEKAAGVGHHVALSVVGADLMTDSGYMRAKVVQENLIKAAHVPYTILRATQFMEFLGAIAQAATVGDEVRVPAAQIQPVAADDVAAALAELAVAPPENGTVELAGPEAFRFEEIIGRYLNAKHETHKITTDPAANYFGSDLHDRYLLPGAHPRIGKIDFPAWMERYMTPA